MQTITSRQNPLVARYREVSRGRRSADGSMLLDGPHLVQEAVAARLAIFDAAFSVAALDSPEQRTLASRLERDGVAVHAVSDHVMEALSPVRAPAGVVAIAARPNWTIEAALARRPQLVLVGVGIQEPGNVGAIVRAAEAGGGTGVVFAGASADPFGWKALRGSMGSAFRVPTAIAGDAEMVLKSARASGITVLAAVPRDGRSPLRCRSARAGGVPAGG